jgi:hypothetical protein
VFQRGADLPLERLIVRTLLGQAAKRGDQQNQGGESKDGSHGGKEGEGRIAADLSSEVKILGASPEV